MLPASSPAASREEYGAMPRLLRLLSPVLILALAWAGPARAADEKIKLKKGDRIVFLGDSITQAGNDPKNPTGYVNLIREELKKKHPDHDLEVIGAGVSGNKVPDLQRRVDKDVIAKKPTLVFIYIGINDVWHGEKDPTKGTSPEKYEEGLKEVIKKIQDAGARVVLCTPSVIGEKLGGKNNLDAKLDEYADISRKVAREMKVPVCDLRKTFVERLKEKNADDQEKGVLTNDRVHLNEAGNRFVAEQMLNMIGD
jgi:lysophospholipase L1-like esterase